MKDTIIKGDGTSRKLKAPSTIPESFEDFRSALVAGNLHVDISLDEDGCDVVGTPLNKASLLKDATAQKFGLNPLTATVDDVLAAVVTPQLSVTAPAGSSITVTDGTTTLTGTGGTVTFSLPNYGTWNITATLSGQSASGSVSVDAVKQYSVSLSYFSATINVTFPSGSTCTCKNGSTTLTATGTPYAFPVPNAGTWEVKSTNGSETATQNVSISTSGQTVNVTLSYKPTASTSPKSGVSYGTDLSGITAAKMKLYGEAISNNSAITNTTSDVYIDDGATHIKMSVGASKNMTIDGGSYEFIIIGFNHDTLTTPTYYGAATATGKAGITWQTRHCLNTKRQMNSSNTNVGGWTSCAMRTSTMNTLYNGFGFKDAVAPVNKLTSAGNQSSTINTDSDKLFLLSEVEIFGNTTYAKAGEGTQYAWYRAGNTKVKNVSGSAYYWWERSPYGSNTTYFCYVGSDGSANRTSASTSLGVAVGFCS